MTTVVVDLNTVLCYDDFADPLLNKRQTFRRKIIFGLHQPFVFHRDFIPSVGNSSPHI